MRQCRSFTLIELVVVCVIMMLAIGLGAGSLRQRSGPAKFEEAVRDFQSFCIATRSQAMELGRDRVVYYNIDERTFTSGDPVKVPTPPEEEVVYFTQIPDEYKSGEEDPDSPDYVAPPNFASPKWKIPEEYRINEEGLESIQDSVLSGTGMQEEVVEVFRFFSDGGASGALKFVLQSDKLAKTFRISPLTGRILVEETEVSEW